MKYLCLILFLFLSNSLCADTIRCGDNIYQKHSGNLLNASTLYKGKTKGISAELKDGKASFSVEGNWVSCCNRIPLPEGSTGKNRMLLVRFQMRSFDCVRGRDGWQNARLDLFFLDAAGKRIGSYLKTNQLTGTNPWKNYADVYPIPENAAFFDVVPANYGKSGKVEMRNVEIFLISETMDLPPPDGRGVQETFSLDDAWRLSTPTREKISLNGLWQFYPCINDESQKALPPSGAGWGWFKVPGHWQGKLPNNDWRGSATPFYLSSRIRQKMPPVLHKAWYRRCITIPHAWQGKRILLKLDLVQSKANIHIDGTSVGTIVFPGGEVDLTRYAKTGRKQELSILLEANPRILTVNMGADRAYTEIHEMDNRGLCGDAELEAVPQNYNISDVAIRTSVKKKQIVFDIGFNKLEAGNYLMEAVVTGPDHFREKFPPAEIVSDGKENVRFSLSANWLAPKLWDIDTPHNLYRAEISLKKPDGHILDRFYPEEFGFREFEIKGQNFLLNGKIIHLRALPITNNAASSVADEASISDLIRKMKEFHVNFLIDSVYSFNPGTFCYQDTYRKMTSQQGMLTSITMPRSLDFPGLSTDAEKQKQFLKIAEYRLRRYQNLPGLVMMATSHNYAGYADHQNPLKIGNGFSPEKYGIHTGKRTEALYAERLLSKLDPSRPVYHHDGGMLGSVHAVNLYQNWAPPQERSDWLENWEQKGTAPVFFVEYGMPHIASWSSARGPGFIWRERLTQCLWLNEFNAETLGEPAYRMDRRKRTFFSRKDVVIEQYNNNPRWFGRRDFPQLDQVRSIYVRKNITDLRLRGISAILPWDGHVFHFPLTFKTGQLLNPDRFQNLKRPGLTPDYKVPFDNCCFTDSINRFRKTLTGEALEQSFRKILVKIGGSPDSFTECSVNFAPGEMVSKSIQILNDTRREQEFQWAWSKNGITERSGTVSVVPGTKAVIPIQFKLPTVPPEKGCRIAVTVTGRNGQIWEDSVTLNLVPPQTVRLQSRVGLYDPEGTTAPLLNRLGLSYKKVTGDRDLKGIQLLILGRFSLDNFPLHLEDALKHGLKLFLMEQRPEALFRLGIRSNTQGLRSVFSNHPRFPEPLKDWRGNSTSLPPFLKQPEGVQPYPSYRWNGFNNRHVWRAGNRGNVAAILPEKPSVGNWLPLYHGGFDLQFAPLLMFTEGKTAAIFCQLELSARTIPDPQAEATFAKALRYLDKAIPPPVRKVWFTGNEELQNQLEKNGVVCEKLIPSGLSSGDLLVIAPGNNLPDNLQTFIENGLNVLACGLAGNELSRLFPDIGAVPGEWMSDYVTGLRNHPEYTGISNAELHFRYPLRFDGFPENSTGGIALNSRRIGKGTVVMMQLPPWKFNRSIHALRTTGRRADFLMMRLLANLGAGFQTGFCRLFEAADNGNQAFVLSSGWKGCFDPHGDGKKNGWHKTEYIVKDWHKVQPGISFESQFPKYSDYDGLFWYRVEFDLPKVCRSGKHELQIGAVDDESWIWLNGRFMGAVTAKTHPGDYWNYNRKIPLKKTDLRPGKQVLTILCNDLRGSGGLQSIPEIVPKQLRFFYADQPEAEDDPYRYYHW